MMKIMLIKMENPRKIKVNIIQTKKSQMREIKKII